MDSAAREALAQRALAFSSAPETEVSVFSELSELTRFTHNTVHQNVSSTDVSIKIRAVIEGRTGVAATNILDDDHLRAAAERAIAMAKLSPSDPDRPPLPGGGPASAPAGSFIDATAQASPHLRAQMCDAIFQSAYQNDLWCAGFVTTSSAGTTIVNSQGVRASFDGTDASINVKMSGKTSSGFAEGYNADVRALDAAAIGKVAAQKTLSGASPKQVDPGEWTVILEPAAFGELFTYIGDHFSAQSYDEGSSFLTGNLEKSVLGSNVTVSDDYAHPLAPGMPFDYEGAPTQRPTLIERGVAKNIVTDSYWAHKLGRPNTGHALPAPNAYGPQALHLVVAAGEKPLTQLISETQRGLLVTRFWYIRTVDEKKAIVTGMTRDGTFLIENGTITRGVRNLRFNQSIIEALNACEFGNELRRTGSYSYSIVVPAAKISGFTFSSTTNF